MENVTQYGDDLHPSDFGSSRHPEKVSDPEFLKEIIDMLNTAYTRFLDHYGALPRPTRVRVPKDKGCTERHVGIIERSIIPALDEMPLNSLEEFNRVLQAKVDRLNTKPFAKRNGCRKSVFEEEEKGETEATPLTIVS